MRLGKLHAENFASYQVLDFDFQGAGLALVYGSTGAGKSVLFDAATWVLYGRTAKGGNVDDIRSWQSNDTTIGTLELESLCVTRIRGTKSDLFWVEEGEYGAICHRGKDLADTQRLLDARLGISADHFIAASYCHEFSPTGAFFTANAKDRREVLEGLADLRLAQQVAEGAKKLKSGARADVARVKSGLDGLGGQIKSLEGTLQSTIERRNQWDLTRAHRLTSLRQKVKTFDAEKAKEVKAVLAKKEEFEITRNRLKEETLPDSWFTIRLDALKTETRCSKCGNLPIKATDEMVRVAGLRANNAERLRQLKAINPHVAALKSAEMKTNAYAEMLAKEEHAVNPFISQVIELTSQKQNIFLEYAEAKSEAAVLSARISALEQVQDLAVQHRATMLHTAVQQIEDETNRYLEKYFDGAFRVGFVLMDDALDVQITKNGYACNYKQLSKGQRGLLRLCFVVAVMRATADMSGVKIEQVFFDEGLDGLDSSLKASAFRLFEELAQVYDSVFVVEHAPEFQTLFHTRYYVELVNDCSEITRES